MNTAVLLQLTGGLATGLTVGALLLMRATRRQDIINTRLRELRGRPAEVASSHGPISLLGLVAYIGSLLVSSGLLSARTLAELRVMLAAAGILGGRGLAIFIGSKLLLMLGCPLAMAFGLSGMGLEPLVHHGLVGGAAVLGMLLPDYVVKQMRARTLKALERGMPDALDMMVICSEAGLSLEPAIERVAREIAAAHPVVAEEFRQTEQALKMTSDRRQALMEMGTRTGLVALQRLGVTLTQSLQYGTPLSQALRVLSAEMRQEALTAFEAKAAKLPVLLTVPMIVFILPTIFMIVIGPAAINIMKVQ